MPSVERIVWNKFGFSHRDKPPYWSGDVRGRMLFPELFAELGYKTGAEIGVQGGNFSLAICQANPTVKLICVDPWKPYAESSPSVSRWEQYYERAKNRLAQYDVEFKRMTSQEAAPTIPNGSLDFVYIDAAHDFDNVMMDLILWAPKVRYEGIIAGHDFAENFRYGVTQAVNAYVHAHGIVNWYVTWSIYGKNRNTIDPSSYFWIQRERYA